MYTVRKATLSDVERVAYIHGMCFPKEFLTLLDKAGLSAYYRFFIENPLGLCFVAEMEGNVVGFVTGWEKGSTYQRPLLRLYGATFAASLLKSSFKHPRRACPLVQARLRVLAQFASEWLSLFAKSKIRGKEGNPSPAAEGQSNESRVVNASLLSIAVLPEHRGTTAATRLNAAFVEECCRRQVSEILLTVHVENLRARSYYEKNGWQLFRQDGQSAHYKLSLSKR